MKSTSIIILTYLIPAFLACEEDKDVIYPAEG